MKIPILALLPAVAAVVAAGYGVQASNALLDKNASKLKAAQALNITYTIRPVSGSPVEYKLTYSRPLQVKIEGPAGTIVSDGKTVRNYNKATNSYTEGPVTDVSLGKIIASDELWAWSAFFLKEPMKGVIDAKTGAKRNLKGKAVTEVNVTFAGDPAKTATIYVDDTTGIANGMAFRRMKGNTPEETLIMASDVKVGEAALAPDLFAFTPPAGSKKVEENAAPEATWASVSAVFAASCNGCHGPASKKGGLDLTTLQAALNGGRNGPCIVPGDPEGSSLIKYLHGTLKPRMPAQAAPLSADKIQLIADWIKAGAKG